MRDRQAHRPRVSVVIETLNWDDAHGLPPDEALRSVRGQTIPAEEIDCIVVLDSKTGHLAPRVRELLPDARLLVHEDERLGYYQMKDRGIRAAESEIVALWDSDTAYDPAWLETMISRFERDDRLVLVGGLPRILRENGRLHPLSLLLFFSAYRGQDPATNFALNSCAVMRDRYLQAPFPDEPARLGLEWGALLRWQERGWRVGLEPAAGSIHESYSSFGMLWKKLVYNGNAQAEGRTQLNEHGPVAYWTAAIRQSLRWAAGGGRNLMLQRRTGLPRRPSCSTRGCRCSSARRAQFCFRGCGGGGGGRGSSSASGSWSLCPQASWCSARSGSTTGSRGSFHWWAAALRRRTATSSRRSQPSRRPRG